MIIYVMAWSGSVLKFIQLDLACILAKSGHISMYVHEVQLMDVIWGCESKSRYM